MASALHREPEGTVERWQLVLPEPTSLALAQAHPRYAYPAFHLIIEGHRVATQV